MHTVRRLFLLTVTFVLLIGALPGCGSTKVRAEACCEPPRDLKTEKAAAGAPAIRRTRWDSHAASLPAEPIGEVTDDWLLLVNKTHPLAADYAPTDLVRITYLVGDHAESMRYMRKEAAEHFELMAGSAEAAGHEIGIRTAYRSYAQQRDIFNSYAARDGEEAANKYSARPGQSEHQTGLCADVTSPSVNYQMTTKYGDAPEGKWLAENAHQFGFIIRFPLGKEHITGYQYEPWHVRYVGIEAATDIAAQGITLEEYLGEVD